MIILLSPAKTFTNNKVISKQKPFFNEEALYLVNHLKSFSLKEIETIFKTSKQLTLNVYNYYNNFNLNYVAIYLYGGQVFKSMDVLNISRESLKNVYIFSALFGLINAFDSISPYRLDFTNKIMTTSLYNYWDNKIDSYIKTNFKDKTIFNLASQEFTNLIDLNNKNIYSFDFIVMKNGQATRPSMIIKTMRGIMAHYLLTNKISNSNQLVNLKINNFKFVNNKNNVITFIKE